MKFVTNFGRYIQKHFLMTKWTCFTQNTGQNPLFGGDFYVNSMDEDTVLSIFMQHFKEDIEKEDPDKICLHRLAWIGTLKNLLIHVGFVFILAACLTLNKPIITLIVVGCYGLYVNLVNNPFHCKVWIRHTYTK